MLGPINLGLGATRRSQNKGSSVPVSFVSTPWSGRKYFSDFWDRVFAAFYAEPKGFPRSETVFNLGYTDVESARYPWVAELSGLVPDQPVLRRGRAE